jgi:hypothetical protein
MTPIGWRAARDVRGLDAEPSRVTPGESVVVHRTPSPSSWRGEAPLRPYVISLVRIVARLHAKEVDRLAEWGREVLSEKTPPGRG